MYAALVIPATSILGEPNTWTVNAYDIDGDYVGTLGRIVRTPTGVRYEGHDGWQQTFDSIEAASISVMQTVFPFDPKKMN